MTCTCFISLAYIILIVVDDTSSFQVQIVVSLDMVTNRLLNNVLKEIGVI